MLTMPTLQNVLDRITLPSFIFWDPLPKFGFGEVKVLQMSYKEIENTCCAPVEWRPKVCDNDDDHLTDDKPPQKGTRSEFSILPKSGFGFNFSRMSF